MIIEFVDGPLKGYIHEVESGMPMPDAVAIMDEVKLVRHWYCRTERAKAVYMRTEPITDDRTSKTRDC
jgi:hypothetical protein